MVCAQKIHSIGRPNCGRKLEANLELVGRNGKWKMDQLHFFFFFLAQLCLNLTQAKWASGTQLRAPPAAEKLRKSLAP